MNGNVAVRFQRPGEEIVGRINSYTRVDIVVIVEVRGTWVFYAATGAADPLDRRGKMATFTVDVTETQLERRES